MKLLFLFLDGVGLGADDPASNPFARAQMPALTGLLAGRRLVAASAPLHSPRATLLPLDACLGVSGMPQSATGQATLLSGRNVPAAIGRHQGPKPDAEVAVFVRNGAIFSRLKNEGRRVAFLNAYPPSYFEAIQSGDRRYGAIPLAAVSAGLPLRTLEDLHGGRALSADFTARGWRTHLKLEATPLLSPFEAGQRLAALAGEVDFSLFEYWLSDYAGHRRNMAEACELLETFDGVLGGLLSAWDDRSGLILITSDHGNLEDLSTRLHTTNPAPALLVGAPELRRAFSRSLHDLADITPATLEFLLASEYSQRARRDQPG
ncbi:MAG: alkaline phosphatase family protein [Anaerolineales bacterium]|nr:alkaline phosphatase family protein [Anaerolineales bacterium]